MILHIIIPDTHTYTPPHTTSITKNSPRDEGETETEWQEEDEESLRNQAFDMHYSRFSDQSKFSDQGFRNPRMLCGVLIYCSEHVV